MKKAKDPIQVIVKLFILSLLLHLCMFYFRLGYFLMVIWPFGLFIGLFLTKSYWKKTGPRFVKFLFVLLGYIFSTGLIWIIFIDQKTVQTYPMIWEDKGMSDHYKETEILLSFTQFPQYFVGIYSNQISNYLHSQDKNLVNVTFEITSDFWCPRGTHEIKIGELSSWDFADGYSGQSGNYDRNSTPWPTHWWCP